MLLWQKSSQKGPQKSILRTACGRIGRALAAAPVPGAKQGAALLRGDTGSPQILRKGRNRASCLHWPSRSHQSCWSSSDWTGLWLDRDHTGQCSNCFLYVTCYFSGSCWGSSAFSSRLCFASAYISTVKYRQLVTTNYTIKFEYFQLPVISTGLEAHNMDM